MKSNLKTPGDDQKAVTTLLRYYVEMFCVVTFAIIISVHGLKQKIPCFIQKASKAMDGFVFFQLDRAQVDTVPLFLDYERVP